MTALDHTGVDRLPPSNLEAEMALLGSILIDRDLMPRIAPIVRPGDFYAQLHEAIFIAIVALYEAAAPIDKVALAEELRSRGMLDKIGGLAYLTSLMDTVPTAASAEYYAKIVREKASLRGLIHLGGEITGFGYDGESDADGAVTTTFARVQQFVDRTSSSTRRPMTLAEASYELDDSLGREGGSFYPTPFPRLTRNIGGWKRRGVYIIASSPKMGKTYLANTVALHLSITIGPVAVWPLEIGRDETQLRLEQAFSGVNSLRRVDPNAAPLTQGEWARIGDARAELAKYPITLFDAHPRWSTAEIVVAARRLAADAPLAGAIIDHVGFLRDVRAHERNTTKHERLDDALNTFLDLARELDMPVFLVWHVNRDAKDGEPTIFQLRDGGNVEGIAQTILFVHREHWDKADGSQRDGKLIIGATRMGKHGEIPVYFDDHRGLWCDSDRYAFFEERPPEPEQGDFPFPDA